MTTPTGARHEVPAEDMFFSTTDRRGVINAANEVFVRIARHPLGELLGAPHNIIRHPDMPGGAFKIVWDLLEAGKPASAYVLNLAGDGSAYWAMASIVPVEGGYLSVRTRPVCEDLRDAAWGLYQSTRAQELATREIGSSAAAAADLGAGLLGDGLRGLGFDTYEQFAIHLLTTETATRRTSIPALPDRPEAPGKLRMILDAVRTVDTRIAELAEQMRRFRDDARGLDGQLHSTQAAMHALESAVSEAVTSARQVGDRAPLLSNAAPHVDAKCAAIAGTVDQVTAAVDELELSRGRLSYAVALAGLQAEMAGRYVIALIDGVEDAASSDAAIRVLGQALESGIAGVESGVAGNLAATAAVRADLTSLASATRILQMSLNSWRTLIENAGVQAEFASVMPRLDAALADSAQQVSALAEALERFGESRVHLDGATLRGQVSTALRLLGPA